MRDLTLFDLDHTLIPFDSGMAWTHFLVERGVLPTEAEASYLAYCHQYVAGTLDIHAMHRACMRPLIPFTRAAIDGWIAEFEGAMAPRIPARMRELVDKHRQAGDLCAIVTATERFIAAPFARLFDVPNLVATEAQLDADQRFTGEIAGEPCFREHKVSRVDAWLAELGLARDGFARTTFYSDSASDLPLLLAVSHPVVIDPDDRLRAHASAAGWPVIDTRVIGG